MKQTNYSQQLGELVKSAKEFIKNSCGTDGEYDCRKKNYGIVHEWETYCTTDATSAYLCKFDQNFLYVTEEMYEENEEEDESAYYTIQWCDVINDSIFCTLADAILDGTLTRKGIEDED